MRPSICASSRPSMDESMHSGLPPPFLLTIRVSPVGSQGAGPHIWGSVLLDAGGRPARELRRGSSFQAGRRGARHPCQRVPPVRNRGDRSPAAGREGRPYQSGGETRTAVCQPAHERPPALPRLVPGGGWLPACGGEEAAGWPVRQVRPSAVPLRYGCGGEASPRRRTHSCLQLLPSSCRASHCRNTPGCISGYVDEGRKDSRKGRRLRRGGAFLSTTGSFTLSSGGNNRAGNGRM